MANIIIFYLCMQGFNRFLPHLEDGTLLCILVSEITGRALVGVNSRPMNKPSMRGNWFRAIEGLRATPSMARR